MSPSLQTACINDCNDFHVHPRPPDSTFSSLWWNQKFGLLFFFVSLFSSFESCTSPPKMRLQQHLSARIPFFSTVVPLYTCPVPSLEVSRLEDEGNRSKWRFLLLPWWINANVAIISSRCLLFRPSYLSFHVRRFFLYNTFGFAVCRPMRTIYGRLVLSVGL